MAVMNADWDQLEECPICAGQDLEAYDRAAAIERCRGCGYIFNNPRPTPAQLADFYSKPAKYGEWLANLGARERMWRRRLVKMSQQGAGGALLDIGAGIGQFLAVAMDGFVSVCGTEVSSEAVDVAAREFAVHLKSGTLAELDGELDDGSFDTITMFHVLEHVHDPGLLLEQCRDLLAPGGSLFIAVPNDRATVARVVAVAAAVRRRRSVGAALRAIYRSGLPRLSLDGELEEIHLSHFTPSVLEGLVRSRGFRIRESGCDPFFVASGPAELLHRALFAVASLIQRWLKQNWYPTIWIAAVRESSA